MQHVSKNTYLVCLSSKGKQKQNGKHYLSVDTTNLVSIFDDRDKVVFNQECLSIQSIVCKPKTIAFFVMKTDKTPI